MTAAACTMFLAGLNGAVIYAVVDAGLRRAPAFTGVLYAVQGGLSPVGCWPARSCGECPERWFAAGGIVIFAAGALLRALPSTPLALAASAAIGFGLPAVLIAALTAVQRETPAGLVGRVAATANTIVFVPNALALAAVAGLVAVVDFVPCCSPSRRAVPPPPPTASGTVSREVVDGKAANADRWGRFGQGHQLQPEPETPASRIAGVSSASGAAIVSFPAGSCVNGAILFAGVGGPGTLSACGTTAPTSSSSVPGRLSY